MSYRDLPYVFAQKYVSFTENPSQSEKKNAAWHLSTWGQKMGCLLDHEV